MATHNVPNRPCLPRSTCITKMYKEVSLNLKKISNVTRKKVLEILTIVFLLLRKRFFVKKSNNGRFFYKKSKIFESVDFFIQKRSGF